MDTSNALTLKLVSNDRWSTEDVLKIKDMIEKVVSATVQIRHEISNWNRFSVHTDEKNKVHHIYDLVQDLFIVDNLRDLTDAQKLAAVLNSTFNNEFALERA